MTQQKAASLTRSLFARKGKASPASLLISEMQASGVDTLEREPYEQDLVDRQPLRADDDPAAETAPVAKAANGKAAGLKGAAGRRKAKAEAELPLLAFVEAQAANGESEPDAVPEAPRAAELPPAASLLERGAQSLRRTNGRAALVVAGPPKSAAPPPAAQAAPASRNVLGSAHESDDDDLDESHEQETVSGDANVAAIEDAPQDEAPDHDAADHAASGPAASSAAASGPAAAEPGVEDAVLVEPKPEPKPESAEIEAAGDAVAGEATESAAPVPAADSAASKAPPEARPEAFHEVSPEAPAEAAVPRIAKDAAAKDETVQADPVKDAPKPVDKTARPWAERQAVSGAAISATVALRNAAALNGAAAGSFMAADTLGGKTTQAKAAVTPPPPAARAGALPWRAVAVVVLGAMLGLGGYLAFSDAPEQPAGDTAGGATAALTAAPPAGPAAAPRESVVTEASGAAGASGADTAPAPQATAPLPAELPEPSFDIIRIEPDGQSIIAGRAEPFSEWILLNNDTPIASVQADANGEWVVLPDASLVPGANAFSLVPKTVRGKVAIPAPDAPSPDASSRDAVPGSGAGVKEGVGTGGLDGQPAMALPKPKPQSAAQAIGASPVSPAAFQVSTDGIYEVQVASVRQSSDAERERNRLTEAFPALLGKLDLRVQEASVEGAGTFFRVRSGAIADLGVARELCRQLEAAGQGCLVVRRPATLDAVPAEVVEETTEAASPANQQAEVPQ
ncbi:MAG: SPOR domain-containing protein [Kiloniellaceae bacterium]